MQKPTHILFPSVIESAAVILSIPQSGRIEGVRRQSHTNRISFLLFLIFNFCYFICLSQGTWTQKANYFGGIRVGIESASFSIGVKGYFGTGWDNINVRKDFWE